MGSPATPACRLQHIAQRTTPRKKMYFLVYKDLNTGEEPHLQDKKGDLMKLIIAGAQTFTDYQHLCQVLAPDRHRITQVLTGGARGADGLGKRWAWSTQVPWKGFGKSAGVRRN